MMAEGKTLVAATTNEHKIAEISSIAGSFGYTVLSRAEAGIPDFEIEETGTTFEENAFLKAKTIFDYLNGDASVVADDSGLEVDALEGAPGVYSARFAGQNAPGVYMETGDGDASDFQAADLDAGQLHRSHQDRANNAKLLRLLAGVPEGKRAARFVSVISCIIPGRDPIICRGEVTGRIDFKETGIAGFGYDPLFIPVGYEYSFGLFKPADKNAISHRGQALVLLAEKLADE
jgi:XTP/dITP diphosphohydrolase